MESIETYLASLPEPKQSDLRKLHELIVGEFPGAPLSFLDGRDEQGKVVTNPNIGYGRQLLRHADGSTKEFYQLGISANTAGLSVFLMGLQDRTYLPETYGRTLGKATVTSYCFKFKRLADVDRTVLVTALRDAFDRTSS